MRHAFRVAASLDSMVLGEPQILGQVKDAYQAAEQAGSLGSVLNALRNRSIAAAKRARTETAIGRNAVSVSHVAVELARKIFGDLRERSVLLVGAGKMSELAARQMVRDGARASVLGGRTFEKAEQLAAALGGRAAPFEALRAGAGAGRHRDQRDRRARHRDPARGRRGGTARPAWPAAVPDRHRGAARRRPRGSRVWPASSCTTSTTSSRWPRPTCASAGRRPRPRRRSSTRRSASSLEWRRSLDVVPLLVELRKRADEIRKAEIEKARRRLGPLTPEQESALEAATSAIVNKLLHAPTVQLKELAGDGHAEHVGLIRKLFGL